MSGKKCLTKIKKEMEEFIWCNDYVINLIEEIQNEKEVLNRIIEDNVETFDDWRFDGSEIYECMVNLTLEQIRYCKDK